MNRAPDINSFFSNETAVSVYIESIYLLTDLYDRFDRLTYYQELAHEVFRDYLPLEFIVSDQDRFFASNLIIETIHRALNSIYDIFTSDRNIHEKIDIVPSSLRENFLAITRQIPSDNLPPTIKWKLARNYRLL
jgi:hypothetical protein